MGENKKQLRYIVGFSVFFIAALLSVIVGYNFPQKKPLALTGVNQQLAYQGRLLNGSGAVVPDGNYNLEFKIYQDGGGCVSGGTSPCGGTLKWTETWTGSNLVTVKNGYFSVQLGAVNPFGTSVDWNQDTLWLSINVGGTGTPTWDGEMTPFRRLSSTPYALNSNALNGLSASQFVQLGQGTVQVDSSTNGSIFINKTGASGNILELQKSGSDVVKVANDGSFSVLNSSSSNALQVINSSSGSVINVDSAATNQNDLIGNSSFENNSTSGWTNKTGCVLSAVTTATTAAYNGTYSGQCANTATSAGFKYITGALSTSTIYTLNFYAKVSTGAGNVLNFGHVENGGAEDAANLSLTSQPVSTSGWARYSLTFKTGATLAAGDYIYIKQNDSTTRSLWIDGATLQTDANAEANYREGKIQLGGVVSSPLVLQNLANSTTALQVLNAAGTQVFNVDTTDTNLVANPDFEVNQQSWSAKGNVSASIIRDSTQQKFGLDSLKITTTANSGDGASYAFASSLPVGTYSLGVSVKTSSAFSAGNFTMGLTNTGGDNNCTTAITPSVTTTLPSTTGWTRFTCNVTIASTAATAFYVKQTEAVARSIWIDGVEVDSGTSQAAYGSGALSLNAVVRTPLDLQNQSDSTAAMSVLSANGDYNLNIDTINERIGVGNGTVGTAAKFYVSNGNTDASIRALQTGAGNILELANAVGSDVFDVSNIGTVTTRTTTNSPGAFQVFDSGFVPNFVVDTNSHTVYIGNFADDASGTLLVLDRKNTAADPTGQNGAMYYNTNTQQFRCYEDGSWENCVSGGTNHDWFMVRPANTGFATVGLNAAQLSLTTGTSNNAGASAFTNVATTTTSGSTAGIVSAASNFNLTRTGYNTSCSILARSPTGALTSGERVAIGLFSAAPANANNFGGSHVAFKFSNATGDTGTGTGWRASTSDGTTNTIGGANVGTSANVIFGTAYLLKFRIDSANSTVYMSVNGGTEDAVTATLPATSTNLGIAAEVINTDSVADNWSFGRFYCEQT